MEKLSIKQNNDNKKKNYSKKSKKQTHKNKSTITVITTKHRKGDNSRAVPGQFARKLPAAELPSYSLCDMTAF